MKTSIYKYLCLLLMTVCSLNAYAYKRGSNDLVHVLRIGLAGGGAFNLTPSECAMTGDLGGGGALAFDYAYYKSFSKVDLGLKTGLDVGYQYSPYRAQFEQRYSNMDYLGNQMDYTISGIVDVKQNQIYASLPLMFALRSNGFVWNIGARVQMAIYQVGKQQLSNPMVQAFYPAYGVRLSNELITGVVAENQMCLPVEFPAIALDIMATTEIGYEYTFKRTKNAIGTVAYFNMGIWNSLPRATDAPIIQVAPITGKDNPVPVVVVNNAYRTLLTSYIPMQFGVKLYYAFTL
jgi:hypothetical protein